MSSAHTSLSTPQSSSVQNTTARLVNRSKKCEHITPVLQRLHWLPVKARIDFKILVLTYKALNNLAPDYISELFCPYLTSRPLRSADQRLLATPRYNTKTYGARAFSVYAANAWNSLPLQIKKSETLNSFKSSVKTYLFRKFYQLE